MPRLLRPFILLFLVSFFGSSIRAQNSAVQVNVTVLDKSSRQAVSGLDLHPECYDRTYKTDSEGKFSFEINSGQCCTVLSSGEQYAESQSSICAKGIAPGGTLNVQILVNRSVDVLLFGKLKNSKTGEYLKNTKVELLDECWQKNRINYCSDQGDFQFSTKIGENCCYRLNVNGGEYRLNQIDFCTNQYQVGQNVQVDILIDPNGKTASIQPRYTYANPSYEQVVSDFNPVSPPRPTGPGAGSNPYISPPRPSGPLYGTEAKEFNYVHFDFDRYNIRADANISLTALVRLMEAHPNLKIEIDAHTDSRGVGSYNDQLSVRRGKSIELYLDKNGVSPARVSVIGFGERRLLNECGDGVKCSEKQHQVNRRAGFTVTENEGGTLFNIINITPTKIVVGGPR